MSPPAITVGTEEASVMSIVPNGTTESVVSSKVVVTNGSQGTLPQTDEATHMYDLATTRFLNDRAQPHVPAGISNLLADPQSFVDFSHRQIDMARHLDTILLPLARPADGADATVNGTEGPVNHGPSPSRPTRDRSPTSVDGEHRATDESNPADAIDDTESLMSVSNDESTERQSASGPDAIS